MNLIVDYNYYVQVYGGDKVGEGFEFNRLSMKAENTVNSYTFGRIRELDDDSEYLGLVKFTICQLIDNFKSVEELGNVKSLSEGKQSVTFSDSEEISRSSHNLIYANLGQTGLTNRVRR